jgi:Integrase core domain
MELDSISCSGTRRICRYRHSGTLAQKLKGNKYLLVITDRFSKLVRTVPLTRITASVVAWAFMKQWADLYGPPRHQLSDNGRQFTSDVFKTCCKAMGVQYIFTSALHLKQMAKLNVSIELFSLVYWH